MNNQFDELTKNMGQSVTRRGALRKFGVGLAGMALASLGLANKASALPTRKCQDQCWKDCRRQFLVGSTDFQACYELCLFQKCSGP